MKKLPKIDLLYWIMIISANTIGEAGGDLISMTTGLGYGWSTTILIALFFAAVVAAVMARAQHLAVYWVVIILSSTAGTTLSDLLTRKTFGTEEQAAYGIGVLVILATMAIIFVVWRLVAPRTHVDDPLTKPVEILYWGAILASSTLGTAFGDYISNGTPLGFAWASVILIVAIAMIGALALFTRLSRDVLYWLAIIVAHPLGATMGDYMTKAEGMNLGNLRATLILTAIFLAIAGFHFVRTRGRARAQLA